MKITKELPQFKNENVLLVVAGTQHADLYRVHDSKVALIKTVHIPTPEYSDREGFFMQRGGGKVYGCGSVYEPKKQTIQEQFAKELISDMKELDQKEGPFKIYLFTPTHVKNLLVKDLPPPLFSRVVYVKSGNYTKAHPFEILSFVERHKEFEREPTHI